MNEKNGSFSLTGNSVPLIKGPKFLAQVGSHSSSPPMIIEGGIRYIAEGKIPPPLIVQDGRIVPSERANYFAGAYAEDEPAPPPAPEPPHELDCIQRMSEAFRGLGITYHHLREL